nr:cytochrome c oxidase subunit II [Conexibacter arvalis]
MDDPGYRVTAQGLDRGEPPADAELVDVTGARWNWRFDYPRHGISEIGTDLRVPTLTLPEDRPVTLRMTSLDVIHAIWIPERRFKQDVFPGRTTTMTVVFPDQGFWRSGGQCNQFCGLRHAEMDFDIRVLSQADYDAWTRERGR